MAEGWVKVHRRLLDAAIMKRPKVNHFWIWCLLKASHSSVKTFVGHVEVGLSPGQFVFGRVKAAAETGLTEQEVRTCVKTLEAMGTIRVAPLLFQKGTSSGPRKTTSLGSMLTIVKWQRYQGRSEGENQPTNQENTRVPPGSNQPPTSKQEGKEFQETPMYARAAATPDSGTPGRVLAVYRVVTGCTGADGNTREGARRLAEAIDAGDLDEADLPVVIRTGLADPRLPNQTLKGVARNFTTYLPVKTAVAGPEREPPAWRVPVSEEERESALELLRETRKKLEKKRTGNGDGGRW
ncbi:MAG: hypothetical protein LIP77_10770 [Planctomycetes bacterium]|nr:hypothetical protein [Planctomycetota bacterium]